MELSTIVNNQDEVIWSKPRIEISSGDIYRVSALWIENSKWEILLAQRGFMKSNGPWKWWAAVAGTVEKDESYDENIYKEAQEEIGLRWMDFKKWEKLFRDMWERKFFCQYYDLYLDRDVDEFILEENEVESVRWFSVEEIKNMYHNNLSLLASSDYIKLKLWL